MRIIKNNKGSMEKIKKVLEKIGLSKNEIKIYLASLSIWQSTASILGQKVGLPRSTARYTCQSLVSKNIMNMIPKKDYFLFTAEDPDKLISLMNREYNAIDSKVRDLQLIMWDLKNLINPNVSITKVKYYQWADGIIEILEDVFKDNKTIYGIVQITENINHEIETYLEKTYISKREKSKITAKSIFNDNLKSQKYAKNDIRMNRTTLFVPSDTLPFNCCIHIYGNKISFFSMNDNDLTWILIENKNIKDTIFSMFKMCWNLATQLEVNQKYKNDLL